MAGYPRGFAGWLAGIAVAVLTSGLLLLPGTLQQRFELSIDLPLPDGWRLGVSAMHALCAFVALVLLGALLAVHVRIGWRRRRLLGSGSALLVTLLLLSVSALGIYYIGDEAAARMASLLHLLAAAGALVLSLWHIPRGRREHRRRVHRHAQHRRG